MSLLLPLISLVTGILIGDWLHSPVWGIIPVSAAVIIYLILIKKTKIPLNAVRLNPHHSVWIFLLFLGIGFFDAYYHKPLSLNSKQIKAIAAADGEVIEVMPYASGDRFIVDVSQTYDTSGDIYGCRNLHILLCTDGASANIGDLIAFPLHLENITDNKNFRSHGYAENLKKRGVNYRSYASADKIIVKTSSNNIKSLASKLRDKLEICIEKSSLQRETSEFIISILLGDRKFLSPDIKNSFNSVGVSHILALSGLHVAIIMGIILTLLFPLQLLGLRLFRYWIAVLFIWCYALFTGMSPSTVRACIMTSFVIIAFSFQRKNSAANSLLASAFIILLFDPSAINDIGMQLSFLCVGGILAFAGPLNTVSRHRHPLLHACTSSILASMIATLGTWVLVSYYFKRVPLLFLPANLLLLPLLPFFLAISLLYVTLLLFGIDLSGIAWILNQCYSLFTNIADHLASLGNSTIDYKATLPVVVLWLSGVLMMGYSLNKRKKLFASLVSAIMFIGSIILIPALKNNPPDGIIFQKNFYDISIATYDNDKESVIEIPRNSVSRVKHHGCDILSLDCHIDIDSIAGYINSTIDNKIGNRNKSKKYLIIGSGFKNLNLREIPRLEEFDKVFLHSSLKKKREAALMKEALDLGLNQIYSIRKDGPFEVKF